MRRGVKSARFEFMITFVEFVLVRFEELHPSQDENDVEFNRQHREYVESQRQLHKKAETVNGLLCKSCGTTAESLGGDQKLLRCSKCQSGADRDSTKSTRATRRLFSSSPPIIKRLWRIGGVARTSEQLLMFLAARSALRQKRNWVISSSSARSVETRRSASSGSVGGTFATRSRSVFSVFHTLILSFFTVSVRNSPGRVATSRIAVACTSRATVQPSPVQRRRPHLVS